MQSPVQYCCGTVSVPLRYCYGTATVLLQYGQDTVRFGSVRFETTIHCMHSIAHVRELVAVEVEPRVRCENKQTLIPTLASFSAIAVGFYPPLNQ